MPKLAAQAKVCPAVTQVIDDKFSPGQVWSFRNRPNEPNATATVLRIDKRRDRTIIHVQLEGLHIRSCEGAPELNSIMHAPIDKDALDRSVLSLLRTGSVPAFEEGYSRWRADCGGVYTITLAEMISVDEMTWNRGSACHF